MKFLTKKRLAHWALTATFGGALIFGVPYLERATTSAPQPPRSGQMALYVFNVGQGDAILAEEGDKQILIDGGPDDAILAKLGEVMPAGDATIDLVVLTHPHSDHLAGLASVVKKYSVGKILKTDAVAGSKIGRDLEAMILEKKIPVDNPAGTKTETVGGMSFSVLAYKNQLEIDKKHKGSDDGLNDSSIVGLLAYGERRFLLMGDATTVVEDNLVDVQAGLRADFLKIGHHGSAYSTGDKFLAAVMPASAVASLGLKNSYGFPAWRVVQSLKAVGAKFLRTDLDGDIMAATDGTSLQVTPEKVR